MTRGEKLRLFEQNTSSFKTTFKTAENGINAIEGRKEEQDDKATTIMAVVVKVEFDVDVDFLRFINKFGVPDCNEFW